MALIRKENVQGPVLREEIVPVLGLGGDVLVRGLLLSQRLELSLRTSGMVTFAQMPELLAVCVLDADEKPVFTAKEWEIFGASNFGSVMVLWDKAMELSGMASKTKTTAEDEPEKKS